MGAAIKGSERGSGVKEDAPSSPCMRLMQLVAQQRQSPCWSKRQGPVCWLLAEWGGPLGRRSREGAGQQKKMRVHHVELSARRTWDVPVGGGVGGHREGGQCTQNRKKETYPNPDKKCELLLVL